jgi:Tfp pilus assembly protein PilO
VNTRKLLIILLAAVLLAVYYLLGMGYLRQSREKAALASQLAEATQSLVQMTPSSDDLEARLAAARADLDSAKNSLPARPSSTQMINAILKLAEECQVGAIPLITNPWATENLGDYSYSVFRLNIAVTGTFTNLVSFVNKLENGELRTLIIENISVSRAEHAPGEATYITASLYLAIYTQSD